MDWAGPPGYVGQQQVHPEQTELLEASAQVSGTKTCDPFYVYLHYDVETDNYPVPRDP